MCVRQPMPTGVTERAPTCREQQTSWHSRARTRVKNFAFKLHAHNVFKTYYKLVIVCASARANFCWRCPVTLRDSVQMITFAMHSPTPEKFSPDRTWRTHPNYFDLFVIAWHCVGCPRAPPSVCILSRSFHQNRAPAHTTCMSNIL